MTGKQIGRAHEHDYFTSALPFAQKGTPVNIPIEISQIISNVDIYNSRSVVS